MKVPGEAVVEAVVDAGKFLIDRFIPDPQKKIEAELELYKYKEENEQKWADRLTDSDKAQVEVNKVEAESDSVFKSGWRPFVGWVSGIAFAFQFVVFPVVQFVAAVMDKIIQLPSFDIEYLMTLLFGLLGLVTLRTYERIKGRIK